MKLCRLDDPAKRDVCIKDSIQSLLPEIKNNPNFFIPMDPFFHENFNGFLKNTLIDGKFAVKNVKTLGMTNALVKNVKSQFNGFGMKLELDLFFPKLSSTGLYKTNFLLSNVKILSKGQFNVTLFNVNNKWSLKGKLVNIDGEQFMEIYDTDIEMDVGDAKVEFSGVFENQILSKCWNIFIYWKIILEISLSDDYLNSFINRYWKLIYKDLIAETKNQWSPLVLDVVNKFFSAYPFKKLMVL